MLYSWTMLRFLSVLTEFLISMRRQLSLAGSTVIGRTIGSTFSSNRILLFKQRTFMYIFIPSARLSLLLLGLRHELGRHLLSVLFGRISGL
jgi:hypothetical protein